MKCSWIALLLSVAGSFIATAPARAQGAYVGVDAVVLVNTLSYSGSGSSYDETYSTGHLRLRGGYRFTELFALEGQLLGANDANEIDPSGNRFKMTTGPIAALYARLDVPVGESSTLYGLAGIASVATRYQRVSPTIGGADREKQESLSFGVGIAIGLFDNLKLNVDYMLYHVGAVSYPVYFNGKPSQVINGLGAGLAYQF